MSWVIECYSVDNDDTTVIAVGTTPDINASEARQHIRDAGFSDCGVEFRIFQSCLAGAVFTRCGPVRLEPGSVIQTVSQANKALLGGLIGARDADRRFAVSVAHLFSRVGEAALSSGGQLLGQCVVRELDEVHVDSMGGPVFADVSVIRLQQDIVADNSVQITDSNGRQTLCRDLRLVEPTANAAVRLLTQDRTSSCNSNLTWQHGFIDKPLISLKIVENESPKTLRNVVLIQSNGEAISHPGDSGTLVLSADDPTDQHGLSVYAMAVGRVDLTSGGSFTVANRLRDILPAIRRDPKYAELFASLGELNLCAGTAAASTQPDSGFSSLPA